MQWFTPAVLYGLRTRDSQTDEMLYPFATVKLRLKSELAGMMFGAGQCDRARALRAPCAIPRR